MSDKKSVMNKRITTHLSGVQSSAKSLKILSRDLLTYVPDTKDCPAVIRLIDGENPAVQRKLTQFFATFLGWDFNPKSERYGKMQKQKQVDAKLEKAEQALEDPNFNFWTWYEADGDKPEKKPKDHKKAVGNAIKAALTDENADNRMSVVDLVALLVADGVDMRILMQAAEGYSRIQELEKLDK